MTLHGGNGAAAVLDRNTSRHVSGSGSSSSATNGASAAAPTSLTHWNSLQQHSAEQVDLSKLIESIRATLRAGGIIAWVTLGLNLERAFAQSENVGLGKGSIKRVFNSSSVPLSDVDARAVVRHIAQDDDAKVSPDAIKNLVCGALTGRRLDLVQSVFEQLDRKRVGYVSYTDILAAHDAAKHPSVMFGEKSVEQVREEFQLSLQTATRHGGPAFVNLYQWMSYFQYICGHVPSDEYFELLMKRVWKATSRTSLGEATAIGTSAMTAAPLQTADYATRRTASNAVGSNSSSYGSGGSGPAMTLLQALQESNPAVASTYSKAAASLSVSTALPPPIPSRLHRSGSLSATSSGSVDGVSPRAAHTTTEFLKGAQFAACMVDPTMRQPSPSGNYVRRSAAASSHGSTTANSVRPEIDAGTTSVLNRVRATIKDRGLRGLVELSRHIRLSDDDSDGFVTLAEFKRAFGGSLANGQLSDVDFRCLFNHLDADRRGVVAVHAVLDLIREPMNLRRYQLVHAAFQTIDRDGSGKLEPSEIVQAYDASKHPDVIAGRRTEDDVFHDFLESFDVESASDASDGKISFEQWTQYYQNVSFFVADDDFFDLLVRNAWQLAHVQVDDSLYGSSGGGSSAATDASRSPSRSSAHVNAMYRVPRGSGHGSSQAFAILQPDLSDQHYEQQRYYASPSGTGSSHSGRTGVPSCMFAANKQTKELRRIIAQLRAALKDQGAVGFLSLQRAFRLMDADENGSISLSEFQRALKECKLHVASADVASLFQHFDANHDNAVDLNEFLAGIREPMTERRMLFVRMAFDSMDRDRNGVLDVRDIVDVYDARKHPDVLSGRKTEHDVFAEFLETFDVDGIHDGKVTFDDWTRYYANISASIDDDDYFELMMRNAWHISGGTGWCANSANRRVLVTHADGTSSVQEVQNDLGVKRWDVARVLATQMGGAAGTSPPARTGFYSVLDHANVAAQSSAAGASVVLRRSHGNSSDALTACLNMTTSGAGSSTSSNASSDPPMRRGSTSNASASLDASADNRREHPVGVQLIIARLQTGLKARGAHGFCGLSRSFRLMDNDGNGSLNVREFRDAMAALELDLSDADARLLFEYFDRDRSGAIDLNEFLAGVRAPMNDRRLFFVHEAFRLMDRDGNGLLEPSDIVEAYDASRHPDVLSGRKSADAVCCEFLETFDVDGIHDGKITLDQWRHYYANVSASIDDDDYFELMMRNAWHISGGTGWCANSTTRRVLVTLADGTDVVREVQNDLGVKAQDVQARLRQQDERSESANPMARVTAFASSLNLADPPVTSAAATRALEHATSTTKKIVTLREASSAAPMEMASSSVISQRPSSPSTTTDVQGDVVLYTIQYRVRQKRVSDIVQLRKRALQYIDAKTGTIAARHCSECLSATLGLTLTEENCVALFAYINQMSDERSTLATAPSSATIGARFVQSSQATSRIAIRKLFECVLGKLSAASSDAARRVFSALQAANKGRVFPVALAKSFQAQQHPDVRFGGASAAAVFQEFAASFEVTGGSDGAVALDHFEAYCVNLRATLGSDELLQLLLRDCFDAGG